MDITDKGLQDEVACLVAKRSGARHVTVTNSLYVILTQGLGVDPAMIDFESKVKIVKGRVDALLGRTIFEFKSDLGRELKKAEERLLDYLQGKEITTKEIHNGIVTDGTVFRAYARKNRGTDNTVNDELKLLGEHKTNPKKSHDLLIWLESALEVNDGLPPDELNIKAELGRDSIFYKLIFGEIQNLWQDLRDDSEVTTKYDIWKRLLNTAYGSEVDKDELFLQHTYLTIVAKSIATVALLKKLPKTGKDLLSGTKFESAHVSGAIESDFFDWVLSHSKGDKLVMDIAQHALKFEWGEIQTDILKILYENLITAEQRHKLGEHYTPDWLAEKMCRKVITDPLETRIIDPACGSGTFLFHAIRLGLEHAEKDNISPDVAIDKLTNNISGIDIHPVAVIFARITYLLALLPTLQKIKIKDNVKLQVYLGDSLQWSVHEMVGEKDLEIPVPAEKENQQYLTDENNGNGNGNIILKFPHEIAKHPTLFDEIMEQMIDEDSSKRSDDDFKIWLSRRELEDSSIKMLCKTYKDLCNLQAQKRNHIWGYVARNLSRPVWLSGEDQKADLVIGNPPWVALSSMGKVIKKRFEEEMKKANLWVGGKTSGQQDLSGYFFVKSCELYLRKEGAIAFIIPHAAIVGDHYEKFRKCRFDRKDSVTVNFTIDDAWDFPSDVKKLFPVPACVLFATYDCSSNKLPEQILRFSGELPIRDANMEQAKKALTETLEEWPQEKKSIAKSIYNSRFKAGANLTPRRLNLIEKKENEMGISSNIQLVKGRVGKLDKKPWCDLSPPENKVESEFIYPVYMGESIVPYRILESFEAVIPWNKKTQELMDSQTTHSKDNDYSYSYPNLRDWLRKAEEIWEKNKSSKSESFLKNVNRYGKLKAKFPIASVQIAYAASGKNPNATIIKNDRAILDVTAYSMAIENAQEGYYLLAIINSKPVAKGIKRWQAEGGFGPRHIHKLIFNLPIPLFNAKQPLHVDLVSAAQKAEKIATQVPLKKGERFDDTRTRFRKILYEHGIAKQIDDLVATLLNLPKA